jgi:hypothetical protein
MLGQRLGEHRHHNIATQVQLAIQQMREAWSDPVERRQSLAPLALLLRGERSLGNLVFTLRGSGLLG